MGVPPKPPGLIAFEGLFELYNRSSGLSPDPPKTTWQNDLAKRPLKYLSKTSSQTNFYFISTF
jgi:hypothetical protein